jgi:DNA-binding beta-propeller fold protein YncE
MELNIATSTAQALSTIERFPHPNPLPRAGEGIRACCRGLCIATLALSAFALSAVVAAAEPDAAAQRVVRDGVAVEFALLPSQGASDHHVPLAGEAARVRFTITDTTSGKPVTRLHPAAWLSRRTLIPGELRPRTAAEKVQELLGGSIFSKADADFNTFRVLALNDDATITVVDPLFGFGGTKLLALVPLPGVGSDWMLSGDNRLLYVTSAEAGKLSVVDTSNWSVSRTLSPCAGPGRLALQPDAHYLWVACAGTAGDAEPGVVAVTADRSEIAARISTGRGVQDIVFSGDSRWAFVSNADDPSLSIIDVRTLKKLRDIKLKGRPADLVYSPLSDSVYVADEVNGTIMVVDAKQHEIVASIPAEAGIAQMRFAPGDRYGFVTVPEKNLVLILDAVSNRIVQRAGIDAAPEQIAFSSDMAFVRRRGSASVGMIPLKEIGQEGQPVPVAEFTGGDSAFGSRTNLADSMVAAPGEAAVVVANPRDKAIYYYMEGMAAPMGTFGNYDREPRAVMVLDRSLHEVAPGVYETSTVLPPADDYDAVFFLSAPRIVHAFTARIAADPARAATGTTVTAQLLALPNQTIVPGQPARLSFRLSAADPQSAAPVPPTDLTLRAVLAPGTWHQRKNIEVSADGGLTFEFTPPHAGLYYFYASSASMDKALANTPCLVLRAVEPSAP